MQSFAHICQKNKLIFYYFSMCHFQLFWMISLFSRQFCFRMMPDNCKLKLCRLWPVSRIIQLNIGDDRGLIHLSEPFDL